MLPSDSQTFIRELGKKAERRHSCRQPSSTTTWRLAAMNMAICGIDFDFDFGKEPADTFTRNHHPDLRLPRHGGTRRRADFVMALPSAAARSLPRSHSADRPKRRINPPFNVSKIDKERLAGDPATPSASRAPTMATTSGSSISTPR
jgi:type I restriction enzyme M protein